MSGDPLDGKVAVVTGASRGIGKQTAVELARSGAVVVLVARTLTATGRLPGTLGETEAAVAAVGGTAVAMPTDLADATAVEELGRRVLDELGRVDVLVNNAAYTGRGITLSVADMTRAQWEAQFAVNVHAPFFLVQAFAPSMRANGGGRIINVTSGAALPEAIVPGRSGEKLRPKSSYGTTKAALNRMGNSLAQELVGDATMVATIEPGKVLTEVMEFMGSQGAHVADAIPVTVPASVIHHLATCPDPLRYTGQLLDAPALAVELGLWAQ